MPARLQHAGGRDRQREEWVAFSVHLAYGVDILLNQLKVHCVVLGEDIFIRGESSDSVNSEFSDSFCASKSTKQADLK